MSAIRIDQGDNGKTWRASPGDTIQILLPENPSTGYRWEAASHLEPVLRLVSSEYSAPAPASLGSAGTRTFTLQALQPGSASLQLALKRSWDSGAPKEQFAAVFQVD